MIVQEDGRQTEVDYHSNFEKRVENYILGRNTLSFETPEEIVRARDETLDILSEIFEKRGEKVYDIIGCWRRLDEAQIASILTWIQAVKNSMKRKTA